LSREWGDDKKTASNKYHGYSRSARGCPAYIRKIVSPQQQRGNSGHGSTEKTVWLGVHGHAPGARLRDFTAEFVAEALNGQEAIQHCLVALGRGFIGPGRRATRKSSASQNWIDRSLHSTRLSCEAMICHVPPRFSHVSVQTWHIFALGWDLSLPRACSRP
jgi:hypothetical protein